MGWQVSGTVSEEKGGKRARTQLDEDTAGEGTHPWRIKLKVDILVMFFLIFFFS